MPVSPIPEGYHSVTPYLVMKNAAAAIEFYKKGFWRCRAVAYGGSWWQDRARGDQDRGLPRHARR